MKKIGSLVLLSGLALGAPSLAQDGQFNIGNLVVSQMGDGTTALSSAAAVASLREYNVSSGFTGDNAAMPTVTSGANRRLVVSGSATSEGQLTFATSGTQLCFQGYDAAPGTLSIATTTAAVANRLFAATDLNLNVDTSTVFTDAYSGGNIRSSVMTGSTVYTAGTSSSTGGVRSAPFGVVGPTTFESTGVTNNRVVNIFGGSVYASSASGTFVGVSLISGGSATLAINTAGTGTGTASPYDFLFSDASTCYIADDRTIANGGGLQKWTFSAGSWSLAYTLGTGLTAGLRSVTMDPATGTFYAISADTATKLVSVVDTGAGSAYSTLYTSVTNTNLRGVEFVAVPAPGSVALLGLGGLFALRRRR